MDEQSTPISSLNNRNDESQDDNSSVVSNILNNYNNLQENNSGELPSLRPDLTKMENEFENKNMNQGIFQHSSNNVAYKKHYDSELDRVGKLNKKNEEQDEDDDDEEDEYEEYELVEIPLWRRLLNEFRIPLFIFIFILIFFNCSFDKQLIKRVAFLGNQFNECNTYGFLFKAFFVSLLSYLLIKFIRF